jgi:hypothetical protein
MPFWSRGGKQLLVVFTPDGAVDGSEMCVAHGLDPDSHWVAFATRLRVDQQDAFLEAVRRCPREKLCDDGSSDGRLARNENAAVSERIVALASPGGSIDHNVVVISDPGPGSGPGPKFIVNLSTSAPGEAAAKAATGP